MTGWRNPDQTIVPDMPDLVGFGNRDEWSRLLSPRVQWTARIPETPKPSAESSSWVHVLLFFTIRYSRRIEEMARPTCIRLDPMSRQYSSNWDSTQRRFTFIRLWVWGPKSLSWPMSLPRRVSWERYIQNRNHWKAGTLWTTCSHELRYAFRVSSHWNVSKLEVGRLRRIPSKRSTNR